MKKLLITIFILAIITVPLLSLAQGPGDLIPCGTSTHTNPCGFTDLMTLINNVINFILFYLALPIAAIMFAYAGFLLVTAQGGEAKTRAKHIFTNAVLGLVLAAGAWLIVKTFLVIMGYNSTDIGTFFK